MGKKSLKPEKKSFKAIFVFLLAASPLAFILLLELILRVAGVGAGSEPFLPVPGWEGVYTDNPGFIHKYVPVPLNRLPTASEGRNIFRMPKPEGTFRVIVIGGSTAQGFPYDSRQSWSGMLEVALENTGLFQQVDVLNLGFSALSSVYVEDAAPKLRQYDPDLILVYSGHNEYYGTPEAGAPFSSALTLWLREWRWYQLLQDALWASKEEGREPLMQQRFLNQNYPPQQNRDLVLAQQFAQRILSATKAWEGISTLVIEPVSNLVSMPPFLSSNDQALEASLKASDSLRSVDEWKTWLNNESVLKDTALGTYYAALVESEEEKEPQWQLFLKAKDNDLVPFRMRTVFADNLSETLGNSKVERLKYVPTFSTWKEKYGAIAFSNTFFIDHVHFGVRGQRALTLEVLENLRLLFPGWEETKWQKAAALVNDPVRLGLALRWNPQVELTARATILTLLRNEPFLGMARQYQPEENSFSLFFYDIPQEMEVFFIDSLRRDPMAFPLGWVNYHMERNELSLAHEILKSLQWNYPGNASTYLNRALFFRQLQYPVSLKFFSIARLLDSANEDIQRMGNNESMSSYKNLDEFQNELNRVKNETAPWEVIDVQIR